MCNGQRSHWHSPLPKWLLFLCVETIQNSLHSYFQIFHYFFNYSYLTVLQNIRHYFSLFTVPHTCQSSSPHLSLPLCLFQILVTIIPFSSLAFTCKWECAIFMHLACPIRHDVLQSCPSCCTWKSLILVYGSMTFHYIYIPHLLSLFIPEWTLGSILSSADWKQCYEKQGCRYLCGILV